MNDGTPGLKGRGYVRQVRRAYLLGAPLLAASIAFAGCDKDPPKPPDTPPPAGAEQITGNERIGWDQRASTAAELAAIRYNIYVDNTPSEIAGVQCADTPGAAGFACSGRLPPLSPGQHTLALTAFTESGGTRLESSRSTTLTVNVAQGSAPAGPPASTSFITPAGERLRAVAVASGLDDPTDIAIAPGGLTFVSERGGRIRVVRGAALQPAPAIVLDDVVTGDRRGLLAVAVDPAFEKNGHVFALYTAAAGFRLVRLRHAAGTLGDAVTILDGIDAPLAAPAAVVRIGPDGKLYVAIDDGGNPHASGDPGIYNGKLLRLNRDGTTPDDQAAGTPVFALGISSPRGLDWSPWNPDAPLLWVIEDAAAGGERLLGVASGALPKRGETLLNYALPPRTGPAGLAVYRGNLIPSFAGDLLVGSADGAALLRLRFDPADPTKIVASERLLPGVLGRIGAVAVAPGGAVYFCAGERLYVVVPETATPAPR